MDTNITSDYPICDSKARAKIAGTIEYFRVEEVGKVELANFWQLTDVYGSVNF